MGFYGNTDRVCAVTHIDITDDDVEMISYQIEKNNFETILSEFFVIIFAWKL